MVAAEPAPPPRRFPRGCRHRRGPPSWPLVVLILLALDDVRRTCDAQASVPSLVPDATKFRIGIQSQGVGTTPAASYAASYALWAPLVPYLNGAVPYVTSTLGRSIEVVPIEVSGNAIAALDHKVWNVLAATPPVIDMLLASPGAVLCAQRASDVRIVASWLPLFRGQPAPYGGVVLLAATASTQTSLTDLAGRTLALAGDPLSSLSTQSVIAEMAARGTYLFDAPSRVVWASADLDVLAPDIAAGGMAAIVPPQNVDTYNAKVAAGTAAGPALVVGQNVRYVDSRYVVPNSPYPSCVPSVPQWALASLNGTDPLAAAAVAAAVMALNATSPALASAGTAGFTIPYNYAGISSVLAAVGIMPMTGTCAVASLTDTTQTVDFYAAILCPPGKFRVSKAEAFASCDKAGLGCPWPSSVCVCSPCRAVPPEPVTVTLAARGSTNATACAKLAVCLQARQRDVITATIADAYGPDLRAALGLASVTRVEAAFSTGVAASVAWANATGGANGTWTFPLPTPLPLGFSLLLVRANGVLLPSSPTVVEAIKPVCPAPQSPTADGFCACANGPSLGVAVDPVTCAAVYSLGGLVGGVTGGAAVIAAAVILGLAWRWRSQAQHAAMASYLIPPGDITFDSPPVVLGVGSYGIVLRGTYRGMSVACKRCRPPGGYGQSATRIHSGQRSGSVMAISVPTDGDDGQELGNGLSHGLSHGLSNGLAPGVLARARVLAAQRAATSQWPGSPPSMAGSAVSAGGATFTASASSAALSPRTTGSLSGASFPATPSVAAGGGSDWLSLLAAGAPADVDGHASRPMGTDRGTGTSSLASGSSGAASSVGPWWCGGGRGRGRRAASAMLAEIATIVGLRSPHIVTVIGTVVVPGQDPVLVMELMARGSLQDLLLFNRTLLFEPEEMLAIIGDISSGVMFLHAATPPIVHRDLKTGNVLIDGAMRAKICDFGFARAGLSAAASASGTPFFMAPEVLRGEPHTTASDVYSYGVCLYQCWSRCEPFESDPDSVADILAAVADSSRVPPRRPWGVAMPPSVPTAFADIIRRCTSARPEARPTMAAICGELRFLDAQSLGARFVSHSRTSLQVLESVFPPRVAQALREGRQVDPETFEATTIYFSDIVGFTDLSARLTAEDVTDLLDRLYQSFDKLAAAEGLFKVDIIGDAYLAIAGLPDPQPDHTARIARFALAAVAAAASTPVKLGDPGFGFVQIRAGFHSGRCVAAVVGKSTPKYTVFGDTCNLASRMETLSKPGRVHLSSESAAALRVQAPELEGHLVARAPIWVKGKGTLKTWWLRPSPDAIESPGGGASFLEVEPQAELPSPPARMHPLQRRHSALGGSMWLAPPVPEFLRRPLPPIAAAPSLGE